MYFALTISVLPALALLCAIRSSVSSSAKLLRNKPSSVVVPLLCAGVASSSVRYLSCTLRGYVSEEWSSHRSSSVDRDSGRTARSTRSESLECFLMWSRKNLSIRPWCKTICVNRERPTIASGTRSDLRNVPSSPGFCFQISTVRSVNGLRLTNPHAHLDTISISSHSGTEIDDISKTLTSSM